MDEVPSKMCQVSSLLQMKPLVCHPERSEATEPQATGLQSSMMSAGVCALGSFARLRMTVWMFIGGRTQARVDLVMRLKMTNLAQASSPVFHLIPLQASLS
jgi:hypothetical protein